MAKVTLTVRNIINLGLWEKVVEYKGWDPYIIKEGRISEDALVDFDDEFKKEAEEQINLEEFDLYTFDIDTNECGKKIRSGIVLAKSLEDAVEKVQKQFNGISQNETNVALLTKEIVASEHDHMIRLSSYSE